MSSSMTGNAKLPDSNDIIVHGRPGQHADISVNIQGDINRDTDSRRVKKNLREGWKWTLYSPIIVAVFPDGEQLLLDGDHRRHMYRLTFPEAQTIPAYLIEVENMEDYHKLFYEVNWEKRKNATKEEVFVHQVKAKISSAIDLNLELIRCGVSVYGSSDRGGVVGFVNGPNVSVGAFRRTLKRGPNEAKKAIALLKRTWPADTKLQGELMEAVALLHVVYPILGDAAKSKIAEDFENWFGNFLSMYSQHAVASDFKSRGGRVHHRHAESIARGLISDYRRAQLINGAVAKYKQNKLSLKLISNLID
jgi:hypothetical protein